MRQCTYTDSSEIPRGSSGCSWAGDVGCLWPKASENMCDSSTQIADSTVGPAPVNRPRFSAFLFQTSQDVARVRPSTHLSLPRCPENAPCRCRPLRIELWRGLRLCRCKLSSWWRFCSKISTPSTWSSPRHKSSHLREVSLSMQTVGQLTQLTYWLGRSGRFLGSPPESSLWSPVAPRRAKAQSLWEARLSLLHTFPGKYRVMQVKWLSPGKPSHWCRRQRDGTRCQQKMGIINILANKKNKNGRWGIRWACACVCRWNVGEMLHRTTS